MDGSGGGSIGYLTPLPPRGSSMLQSPPSVEAKACDAILEVVVDK